MSRTSRLLSRHAAALSFPFVCRASMAVLLVCSLQVMTCEHMCNRGSRTGCATVALSVRVVLSLSLSLSLVRCSAPLPPVSAVHRVHTFFLDRGYHRGASVCGLETLDPLWTSRYCRVGVLTLWSLVVSCLVVCMVRRGLRRARLAASACNRWRCAVNESSLAFGRYALR